MLVGAAVADVGVLDYSITAAGAVLDTLALLSGSGNALGSESKVRYDFDRQTHRFWCTAWKTVDTRELRPETVMVPYYWGLNRTMLTVSVTNLQPYGTVCALADHHPCNLLRNSSLFQGFFPGTRDIT